jgi:hypothetical protein
VAFAKKLTAFKLLANKESKEKVDNTAVFIIAAFDASPL